jgi:hypothetical protein
MYGQQNVKFRLRGIDKMRCEEQIDYCLTLEIGEDILWNQNRLLVIPLYP